MNLTQPEGLLGYIYTGVRAKVLPSDKKRSGCCKTEAFVSRVGGFFFSISACKFLSYRVCVRFAVHVRGR